MSERQQWKILFISSADVMQILLDVPLRSVERNEAPSLGCIPWVLSPGDLPLCSLVFHDLGLSAYDFYGVPLIFVFV